MGTLDDVATLTALRSALDHVRANLAGPGSDGVTVQQFCGHADDELARLRDELLSRQYRPRPARQFRIAKPGGGHRVLALSSVRDRVVQHALATALSSHFDSALHPSAFAWRRGRSTRDALLAVDRALSDGRQWVFRGDIEEFFDRIPPSLLLRALQDLTADGDLVALIETLLSAGALLGGQILDPTLGTAQGSPISPFLANLYLLPFDEAVAGAGMPMVRYGDDLCIPALSREEAERARRLTVDSLHRLRLSLNPKKVEVRHRGEGFVFLGYQFDGSGRRSGDKARRSLRERLEALLAEPADDAALEHLLRGWAAYYGSFAGVDLPDAVRERAEALTMVSAQARQLGDLTGATKTRTGGAAIDASTAVAPAEPVAAQTPTRWQTAALRLSGAMGTGDGAAVRESTRRELELSKQDAPAVLDALARFDGNALAELLAGLGRFGDADDAATVTRPPSTVPSKARSSGVPVIAEDSGEPPRFSPQSGDAERLLDLFGGAEHAFLRDIKVGDRVERQRMMTAPTAEHARAHLVGTWWLGVYPLRGNNTVRFGAVRVVVPNKDRRGAAMPAAIVDDARRVAAAVRALGLSPVLSIEPGRSLMVWVLFQEAVTAARGRTLLSLILHRAGDPPAGVIRELLPAQDTAKPDKPGTGVLLPLGLDPRTGERAWFFDDQMLPVIDACAWLRGLRPDPADKVAEAVGVQKSRLPVLTSATTKAPLPAARTTGTEAQAKAPGDDAGPRPTGVATGAGAVFHDLPRAAEVLTGCAVLRHFVDQAVRGGGLSTSERYLTAEILGRLGQEAVPALDAVFRHLEDWRPGMGARFSQRLYPHPTSCGRIRQRLPELTSRVGCDCRFRVPPGAYPTPVLHAMGAADVPGMELRVKEAAARGGIARAAIESMNEGRRELGAKASALCTRLTDLRRQQKALAKTLEAVEHELDVVMDEAGDTPLDTPSGALRRVNEQGVRRFVLDV